MADFGDALFTEPALRSIHKAYPEAQLDVLTTKSGLPALERLPYLHDILLFDKYRFDNPRSAFNPSNLKMVVDFGWKLLRTRYDAIIFFHHLTTRWGTFKYAGLALTTLARVRAGLDNGTGRAWFLNHKIPDKGFGYNGQNEKTYWLQLASSLGATEISGVVETTPQFLVYDSERNFAQSRICDIRQGQDEVPVVAVYPGSGNYSLARRWLPKRFAQVADTLITDFKAKVVIVGSQDEVPLALQIQNLMQQPVTILSGQTSLPQAGAILEKCTLFIGNDGGLLHLAAAMNIPTVAIFGPTNAQAWGWNSNADKMQIVQAPIDLPCRPCLYRGITLGKRFGCAPRPCLTEISAAQVMGAATLQLLKQSD